MSRPLLPFLFSQFQTDKQTHSELTVTAVLHKNTSKWRAGGSSSSNEQGGLLWHRPCWAHGWFSIYASTDPIPKQLACCRKCAMICKSHTIYSQYNIGKHEQSVKCSYVIKSISNIWIWRHNTQMIGRGSGAERRQLKELFAANDVHWQQISNTAGYERSILERQSLSEVKMDSWPICKTNLLLQFQNNDKAF